MEYLSTKEAAKMWQMDLSQVGKLARAGKILGAKQVGSRWLIPAGSRRPDDGRTRAAKRKSKEVASFRFPSYFNSNPDFYRPPLNPEEQILHRVTVLTDACRFAEARDVLGNLYDTTESIYTRISALFCASVLAIELRDKQASDYLRRFYLLFSEEFPHRKEMLLLMYMMDLNLGTFHARGNDFQTDTGADYSENAQATLQMLCAASLCQSSVHHPSSSLIMYAQCCETIEKNGYYAEAQAMALYLALVCIMQEKTESALFHIRRVLRLAETHKLFYVPATSYYYESYLYDLVLPEFSPELGQMLRTTSQSIHESELFYAENASMNSIFTKLPSKSYQLLLYVVLNYPNKKVSALINRSEATVSNMYAEICHILGVKGKKELRRYAKATLGSNGTLPK